MRCRVVTATAAAVLCSAVSGQTVGSVEEIVVTATRSEDRVEPSSVVLSYDDLAELAPVATADVFRNLTGVSLRTNSRGDSVIRIRGSEERQTLIFLDGAPLATPWDGRTDLALLPAGLIDRVEISKGVVPIEYGANAVAGAVDLRTFVPRDSLTVRAEAQAGSEGLRSVSAIAGMATAAGWSFTAGLSDVLRDGERIADRESIPFDPANDDERTNTDLDGTSLYAATAFAAESFSIRLSALHADVDRGVAAQSDRDPNLSRVRFWRIPDWQLTQIILNAGVSTGENSELRATVWQQWFEQQIDAYNDYSYTALQARELGEDDTRGIRTSWSFAFEPLTLRLVATAQESTHDQIESDIDNDVVIDGPQLRYRQQLFTVGSEVDVPLAETLTSTFGLARDRALTPLTGDKPAQPSLSANSWSAALRWTPSDIASVSLSVGERSRFATPRELYGAALGRFLINPDLLPERAVLTDLSAVIQASDTLQLDLALWSNQSDDTLSQRNVSVDGVSRRQRYNTSGSSSIGFDAAATWYLTDSLRAELSVALQDVQMSRDSNGERPPVLQRPEQQFRAALDWQATERVDLRAEVMHTGEAYDLDDDDSLIELPASTSINLRGFLTLREWQGLTLQLTAAVDNLTNELVLPQLGLPAPGRVARLGIRLN